MCVNQNERAIYLVPETINGIVAGYKCGIVENTVNKTHIFEVNDFFIVA